MKTIALLSLASLTAAQQAYTYGTIDNPKNITGVVPEDGQYYYDYKFNDVVVKDGVMGVITSTNTFQQMRNYTNADGTISYQQPRGPVGPPEDYLKPPAKQTYTAPTDYCVKDPSFLDGRFETKGCDCPNPYSSEMDVLMPMPKDCRIYENASPCAEYELDYTLKVKSCKLSEVCIAMIQQPKCTEFYPKKSNYISWSSSSSNSQLAAAVALVAVGSTLF